VAITETKGADIMSRDQYDPLADEIMAQEMAAKPDATFCMYQGCGREYDPADSDAPRPNDWCSAACQRKSFGG
jgi:hypothetical protein